jgi:hypothetical protein
LPRLANEIEKRTGERISKSRLSVVLKKGALPGPTGQARGLKGPRPRHTLKGRQDADAVGRPKPAISPCCFGDESEALTHPYLARAWAKRGCDLRVEAPGQSKKRAMIGALDCAARKLIAVVY